MFNFLLDPPDLSLRQPLTITAILPLFLSYYALGALAIFPNTIFFKLSLLPVVIWQAWRCTVDLDVSAWLAQLLELESTDRLNFWNFAFVMAMFFMVLRALEWTFVVNTPVRRYELQMDKDTPVERNLSISNVLLDAFDLFCNQRGIGWSWSAKPFPRWSTPPPSITSVFAKMLLKFTAFDTAQYIIQRVLPSVDQPGGGSFFDPNLSFFPRTALAAFAAICGGVWVYAILDAMYHISTLIGRLVLRQPASVWPPNSHRPWLSTSLREFWSFRWHQFFRHVFITFGARPMGALFGQPGAVMGAFAVSAVIHHVGLWGLGYGAEFSTAGGFFLLMGLGAVMEGAFKEATGLRVRGLSGWLWTMLWVLVWGTFMLDGWARRGMLASDFFPNRLRPGKALIDTVISISNEGRHRDMWLS